MKKTITRRSERMIILTSGHIFLYDNRGIHPRTCAVETGMQYTRLHVHHHLAFARISHPRLNPYRIRCPQDWIARKEMTNSNSMS